MFVFLIIFMITKVINTHFVVTEFSFFHWKSPCIESFILKYKQDFLIIYITGTAIIAHLINLAQFQKFSGIFFCYFLKCMFYFLMLFIVLYLYLCKELFILHWYFGFLVRFLGIRLFNIWSYTINKKFANCWENTVNKHRKC